MTFEKEHSFALSKGVFFLDKRLDGMRRRRRDDLRFFQTVFYNYINEIKEMK